MMTFVTIDRTILIMMTHMIMRSCMVVMVRWKVKCVMIPVGRMLLVVGLSSPEFGPVTSQLALCSHQNRLLPRLETDRPQYDWIAGVTLLTRPSRTEPLSGLTSVTRLPAKRTHRMIPGMRTAHSRPNPTGWASLRPTSRAHWHRMVPKLEINSSRPIPISQEKLNHTGQYRTK